MTRMVLNQESAAALQSLVGDSYKIPEGAEIFTGDERDETIVVQLPGGLHKNLAETYVISPDGIYRAPACKLGADGEQVVPECRVINSSDPKKISGKISNPQVLREFMAAIDTSEISLLNRHSLDDNKVAQFKKMMGVS